MAICNGYVELPEGSGPWPFSMSQTLHQTSGLLGLLEAQLLPRPLCQRRPTGARRRCRAFGSNPDPRVVAIALWKLSIAVENDHTLQLQTCETETVFGDDFWGLNTVSKGIWSTRDRCR